MQLFAIAILLLAMTARTASDYALGLTAAGLVAVAAASTAIDTWEKLWLFAWITMPWVYALETPFMSDEALVEWRAHYTALRWLAVGAAGLMGGVHGGLLSIPRKVRMASGAVVTCEMWVIFYLRGVAHVVGVPVCAAFSSCLVIGLFLHRKEQGLALVPASALTTHGDNRASDERSSVPDSLFDKPYIPAPLAHSSEASLPPGPPSSDAASSSGRGPPSTSAEVPLSWAEADRQFYASPAGKAYLAANPAHPAECSTSRPSSRGPETFATHSVQLRRGVDVAFGRDPASAPAPSALPPPARPPRASSATTKRPRPVEGPAPPARSFLNASMRSLQRCDWGKALTLRWESLTDCERETQLVAALNCAANNEPPSPAPAPASLPTAASGTELAGLACAEASTAPLTSASTPEHPGLPLTTTAGPGVRLADLMGLTELQDDQAEAALSSALFDDTPPSV